MRTTLIELFPSIPKLSKSHAERFRSAPTGKRAVRIRLRSRSVALLTHWPEAPRPHDLKEQSTKLDRSSATWIEGMGEPDKVLWIARIEDLMRGLTGREC